MNEAKGKIQQLVEKYESVKSSGEIKKYTEEETKNAFIKPLFEALGWDFSEKEEVSAEEHISLAGRLDYGFHINGRPKFYLEVKKLKADLNNEEFARQAIKYSFNKGVTWAVLTDFEGIKVFNAQSPSKFLVDKQYFELKYSEYLERFDKLWELSKESFKEDLIDQKAIEAGKKLQKIPITELLSKDLNECRKILTEQLGKWNPDVPQDLLDEGVQKLLDRLVFIKVAEDRKIENNVLLPLINQWRLLTGPNKPTLYQSMIKKFRELDGIYNSSIFKEHPFETWEESGEVLEEVLDILNGKKGYYEFDFSIMSADTLGSVYENYLGYKLSQSRKGLTLHKDAGKRKEQGIYYTPPFIVDYIVRNALKPVLDKCKSVNDLKKIKVLDPACGSGSFLIKALEIILEKYKDFNYEDNENLRIQIILENIFGVDLDEQAVEIARLNLLVNALKERGKLPSLENNIKNGNSLISGTDGELEKYFGKNFRDKKAFNWEEKFPEVFNRDNPGFEVVVGKPPYISFYSSESHLDLYKQDLNFLIEKYELTQKYSDRRLNTVMFFIERSVGVLRQNGLLGFVIDANFLEKPFRASRSLLADREYVLKISKKFSVFENVTSDQVLLIVNKKKQKQGVGILGLNKEENIFVLDKNTLSLDEFKNDVLNLNNKKVNISSNLALQDLAFVSTGVQIGIGGERIYQGQKIEDLFYSQDKKTENFYENISLASRDFFRYSTVRIKGYVNLDEELAAKINKNVKKCNIAVTKAQPFRDEKKIFIRQSSPIISATLGGLRQISEYSAFMVKPFNEVDTYCLLSILNSRLITYYAKQENVILTGSKKQPQIRIKGLQKLPFPKINAQSKSTLSSYGKLMITFNQEMSEIQENSNRWNSIKSEIEKTDKKIDEEVYKLYGLTSEEIKIVENS